MKGVSCFNGGVAFLIGGGGGFIFKWGLAPHCGGIGFDGGGGG